MTDTAVNTLYRDRQFIVVAEAIVDVRPGARHAEGQTDTTDCPSGDPAGWIVGGRRILGKVVQPPIDKTTGAYQRARAWASQIKHARDQGLPIAHLTPREAARLTFPYGHPTPGVVYVGHPHVADIYYPASSFHVSTFEHKFAELKRILSTLGAAHIRIDHRSGWSHKHAATLVAPLPFLGAQSSGGGGRRKAEHEHMLYEGEYAGSDKPYLPDGLVWYPAEPTWQSVVEDRLNRQNPLKKCLLVMEYTHDYGIDAKLKGKILKAKLDLGGRFVEHTTTVWNVTVEFPV